MVQLLKDIYEPPMIFQIDSPSGSICAFSSTLEDEHKFYEAIETYCHMDEDLINDFLMYIEDRVEHPGFLANIRVSSNARGQGFGRNLMDAFQQSFASQTDMDFLIAHIDNPQEDGFQLLHFYRGYGFEPVIEEDGMVLMANKGWAKELRMDVFADRLIKKRQERGSSLAL